MTDTAYTSNRAIQIPDLEIKTDNPKYIYVPLRGYGFTMAVFDWFDNCSTIEDYARKGYRLCCIGWISVLTLGCTSVGEWIVKNKWIDGGC